MKAITFYENWWRLAMNKDTPSKQAACVMALLRYAFDGEAPSKPTSDSPAEDWAAYDGFLAAQPIIDTFKAKSDAGARGNSRRWKSQSVIAERNRREVSQNDIAENASLIQHNTTQHHNSGVSHTLDQLISIGKSRYCPPIPDTWVREFYSRMEQSGWKRPNGRKVVDAAAEMSAWWAREEKDSQPSTSLPYDDCPFGGLGEVD